MIISIARLVLVLCLAQSKMYQYDHASQLNYDGSTINYIRYSIIIIIKVSHLNQAAVVNYIIIESDSPILRLDTCSASEVRFTCTVNGTEMQWKIDFSRHSDIMARYFSDDMIGDRRDVITNRGTFYTFNLTSTTPLISTMMANVSRDLDGATVICQDGFMDAALQDKMCLHGKAFACYSYRLTAKASYSYCLTSQLIFASYR